MKWVNLKSYKCPRCDTTLVPDEFLGSHICGNPRCAFKISESKLANIVSDRHRVAPYGTIEHDEEENMTGLNSL